MQIYIVVCICSQGFGTLVSACGVVMYRLLLLACCFVSVCFYFFFSFQFLHCNVKSSDDNCSIFFSFLSLPFHPRSSFSPHPKQGLPHSLIPPLPKRPALEKTNGATTMFNAGMLQYQQALANMQFQQQFIPSGRDLSYT